MVKIAEATNVLQQVALLPPDRILQSQGMYEDDHPCCVGAHLANLLGVAESSDLDYMAGATE